jgi:AcrR family transcriptional regulator
MDSPSNGIVPFDGCKGQTIFNSTDSRDNKGYSFVSGITAISTHTAAVLAQGDRLPTRVEHLLAVGLREFLAHGYHRASVEGIGKAAGVSKQTIYRHFCDKSEILRAIVQQTGSMFETRAVSTPVSEGALAVLTGCVLPVRRSFLTNDVLKLFRLSISLAAQLRELSATLNGYFVASLTPINEQMVALADDGQIEIRDPLAASAILGVLSVEGTRFLMGFDAKESLPAASAAIADLFLNGFVGRTSNAWPEFADALATEPDDRTANLHSDLKSYFQGVSELRLREEGLQRLVAVARKSFFADGYRNSSLDEIGPEAKVGRGTLYRWFGDKEGLFKVTMLHAAAEIGAIKMPVCKPGVPIEETLTDIALAVSGALVGPTGTGLYRTVIAEAGQYPDLARTVYQLTRARMIAALTFAFAQTEAGRHLTPGQSLWAAMQFITLATDGNRYLSLNTRLTVADRRALAERTARTFLYGYGKLGNR